MSTTKEASPHHLHKGETMCDTDFDKLLEQVGNTGRYQKRVYWIFFIPINFLMPWVALAPIFMSATPTHWCKVPGRPQGLTEAQWKELTVPREGKEFSKCEQYNVSGEALLNLLDTNHMDPTNLTFIAMHVRETYGTTECQSGWEFDRSSYNNTLSMSESWVCGRSQLESTWLSVGIAGNVIGTIIINSLSDIFGRRPMMTLTIVLFSVFGVVRLYVTTTTWMMATMFIASLSFPAMYELPLIIMMEQVSHEWRALITSYSFIVWTLGSCLLALIAWGTAEWQLLGLVTTVPFFAFILSWCLLPESARWLLSRSRVDECAELLQKMAAVNQRPVPEKLHNTLHELAKEQNKEDNYGILQLFKYPVLRQRTLLLAACYIADNFFYYGQVYNLNNLSGDPYLNFFLVSLTEIPSSLLGWWAAQVLGRRWTAVGGFAFAALFALVTAFIQDLDNVWASVVLQILSKLFISISFLVVFLQCSEIFPTTHRACGTGFSSIAASCFGILAPYVSYVSKFGSWIPFIILFGVGIFGCICSAFLPETLNTQLPQTLLEATNHLTDEKFWSYKGRRYGFTKINNSTVNETDKGKTNLEMSELDIDTKANSLVEEGRINMAMSEQGIHEKTN